MRPTAVCGIPRIFQKVRAGVITAVPRTGARGAAREAELGEVRDGGPAPGREGRSLLPGTAAKFALADRLVLRRVRELLGGRIRFLICGSAKLSPQVQEWFAAAGLTLTEGYGLTESTAVTFYNLHSEPRFGTVGRIVPSSQVRIADDGEILLPLRRPGVKRSAPVNAESTTGLG